MKIQILYFSWKIFRHNLCWLKEIHEARINSFKMVCITNLISFKCWELLIQNAYMLSLNIKGTLLEICFLIKPNICSSCQIWSITWLYDINRTCCIFCLNLEPSLAVFFFMMLLSIVLILQLIAMGVVFSNDALLVQLGNMVRSWLQKFLPMDSSWLKMILGNYLISLSLSLSGGICLSFFCPWETKGILFLKTPSFLWCTSGCKNCVKEREGVHLYVLHFYVTILFLLFHFFSKLFFM